MGSKRLESPMVCTESALDRRQRAPLDWGGYILRPTDPKVRALDVPNSSGIYAWHSRDGDLLYIGRSVSMNSRLRMHHMPGFGGFALSYRLVPEEFLAGVEMAHVKTLEPFHNVAHEAAGLPFWDAMCGAIDAAWRDVWPEMRERVQARESAIIEQIAARL
jgi:hypothetical protein